VAVLLNPVMPKAAAKLWAALGAEPSLGPLTAQRVDEVATWGRLPGGSKVTKIEPLFPRIEEPDAP
ncbi:MAG: methionine--tRNA ligase, partial [Actinomycetes bacterium]